jgi:hypothetical protein
MNALHTTRPIRSARALMGVAILSLAGAITPLAAQTPTTVLAGGSVGASYASQSADVPVYASGSDCGVFESGSGMAGSVDGRLVLPMFFAEAVGIDARLRVAYDGARLTATPVEPTTVRSEDGESLVVLDREFRLERTGVLASIDLLARAAVDRFALGAGVSLGARIGSTLEQTDNVLGPGSNRFADGQSSHAMEPSSGESSPLVLAPMVSVGYALPVGVKTQLVPELSVRFDALSSLRNSSWRATTIGFAIALLFDLTPGASPIVPGPRGE